MNQIQIDLQSEIGELEHVIIHTPGPEVENMTPQNAERALYSDILNLSVVEQEYAQFKQVLQLHAKILEVSKLLLVVLKKKGVKEQLLKDIIQFEKINENIDYLMSVDDSEVARMLIQGVIMKKDNLTRYFSEERYSLRPLHNFFFTRDSASAIGDHVLINRMASNVRERESLIMESIFKNHPMFATKTHNPVRSHCYLPEITTEGGDILIAREDILMLGTGVRTSSQGIDYVLEQVKKREGVSHIIVQELPETPESFIHLDMVFTFLNQEHCMVFEPLVITPNNFRTVHITVDNGKVTIRTEKSIPDTLKKLGMDLKPIYCGGHKDKRVQEREQWHSAVNLFAMAPGKIMGYGRNVYTLEELNKYGFEILPATDIITGKKVLNDYQKYMVTIDGAELPRGGGGARCMTMPIRRKKVNW